MPSGQPREPAPTEASVRQAQQLEFLMHSIGMLMQQNDEMQEQFKRFSSKEACSTGAEHAESMKPPHSSDAHDDPYGRFSTSGKSGRTPHSARGDGPYSHSYGFEKFGLDSPDEYRGYDLKRAGIYSIAKLDPSASDDTVHLSTSPRA